MSRLDALWYTGPETTVRELVHALKYRFAPKVAEWAGTLLAGLLDGVGSAPDLVVPIPLHRSRFVERGFNQAELLAKGVSRATGLPVLQALVRQLPGESQTSRSRVGRRTLPEETFLVQTDIRDRRIVLVDDVVTTGSTLNAAAEVLLAGGAAEVDGLAMAVSRRPGAP